MDHTVSKQTFQIVKCKSCGLVFTNPIPPESEIAKYYQSEEYISHSDTKRGLVAKIYHLVRNYAVGQKLKLVSTFVSRGTLLDFGCGTGAFLERARKSGWEVTGMEPDPGARALAAHTGLSVLGSLDEVNRSVAPDSMTAITLWHVLEHVYVLHDTVESLTRILSPRGVIIVAVPNHVSRDADYYGKHWAAYDVPRHLYHFDRKTITQLMTTHGLRLEDVRPMVFDSFYVSLLSEKYRHGNTRLFRGFLRGLMSNLSALRTGEYSSLIYVFRKG